MTTYILLDIDGCVSPLYSYEGSGVHIRQNYANWSIPDSTVEILKSFDENTKVLWASAHEEESNHINAALEIQAFDYINFDRDNIESKHWFKHDPIKDFIETLKEDDQVIWVDDEITEESALEMEALGNVYCIIPDGRTGLKLNDFAIIHELISAHGNEEDYLV